MSYTDYAHEARRARSTASAATRRAEADARTAAEWYLGAAQARHQAARLTRTPELWRRGWTPASRENHATDLIRTADRYLRSSFHSTGLAASYRELGRKYAELQARRDASLDV